MRYLYRSGERHVVLPKGDAVATDIQFTREDGRSRELEAGVTGVISGHPVPALTVHATQASKLTYERRLSSWRKSLTYETYPPPLIGHRDGGLTTLFSQVGIGSQQRDYSSVPESSFFRVSSAHARGCCCKRIRPWKCRQRRSRYSPYDRTAHWSGQTQAQLHLWTPEIYENINHPLTIAREVDAESIDELMLQKDSPHALRELRRYLHFDFDVEIRLREIGWSFWGMFKSSSKPPELRAKNDSGKPLPVDRSKFCVSCCLERVNWPRYETRDLQGEAEEQVCVLYGE